MKFCEFWHDNLELVYKIMATEQRRGNY